MRSSELAALAGVTVRTLRHYHQIGLLPEPGRASNGYRDYDVHDLLAVLRIRRLAGLGIPLDRVAASLAAEPDAGDAELAALDAELSAQIEKLEAQRATIAVLRRERAHPDLPAEFARFAHAFARARSASAVEIDRELLVLLTHLAGESSAALAGWLERFVGVASLERAHELQLRFDELPPDSPDEELAAIAEALLALYAPVFGDAEGLPEVAFAPVAGQLVDEYSGSRLNRAQHAVLQRLEAGFARLTT